MLENCLLTWTCGASALLMMQKVNRADRIASSAATEQWVNKQTRVDKHEISIWLHFQLCKYIMVLSNVCLPPSTQMIGSFESMTCNKMKTLKHKNIKIITTIAQQHIERTTVAPHSTKIYRLVLLTPKGTRKSEKSWCRAKWWGKR